MPVSICRITYYWRRLCRRDRTQFYPEDCVAAVVWVVLDNRMRHRRTSTFGLAVVGGGGGGGDLIARTNYIMLESASICTRIAVKSKTFPILTSNETIIISPLRPVRLCCFHMVIPVGQQVRQRQPGFIRKMETARDDYMQTRLNVGFLTSATTGDFID